MNVTLTELRYLIALDKERHFGRAAQRAHVSQPTLSVAVKKLERELDVAVFERNRGEAQVTTNGRRIIDQAYRVLGEVRTLETVAEQGRDELKGPLRLGVIHTVCPYLLPHLLPHLHETTPDMPLVIEENLVQSLTQQLHNNELDAIIVAAPFDVPGFATWPVYEESFVVAMPRDHRWTERDSISLAELPEENLLLLGSGHCLHDQLVALCPSCHDTHGSNRIHSRTSLDTIRHMVASGLGITVLPRSSISAMSLESQLLAMRPLTSKHEPKRRINIAWRRGFPRPEAIKALRNAILQYDPPAGVAMLGNAEPHNAAPDVADILSAPQQSLGHD